MLINVICIFMIIMGKFKVETIVRDRIEIRHIKGLYKIKSIYLNTKKNNWIIY